MLVPNYCTEVNDGIHYVRLHASQKLECMPCREQEFDAVFEFLIERLQSRTGG